MVYRKVVYIETGPKEFHCTVVTGEYEHKVGSGKKQRCCIGRVIVLLWQAGTDKEMKEPRFVYSHIPFAVYIVWNFGIHTKSIGAGDLWNIGNYHLALGQDY